MSATFDALCYVRIFSDNGDKVFNENRWKIIPVRNGKGFNYVSSRLHCLSRDVGITIGKICESYGDEMLYLYENGDECQIYIWLKKGGRIEKLNAVEITAQVMRFLSNFDASICFSADPGFPSI